MKRMCIGFLVLGLMIICGHVFAQTASQPQRLGVTDDDVKAVANNLDKIEQDLEKHDYNPATTDDVSYEKVAADLDNILKRYGVSGPNRVQKTVAIISGAAYEQSAAEIEKEVDAATLSYMKSMGMDPYTTIQELKKGIHPDDMKVISRNARLFNKMFDD